MLDFTKHFIPLLKELEIKEILHEVCVCGDGLKIVFADGSGIALNKDTYGHNAGLLEGYNGKFISKYDDVTGCLTYAEAIELLI